MDKIINIPKNSFRIVRIICCSIVVYEHFFFLTGIEVPVFDLREDAVRIFFIISGFWVTRSYLLTDSLWIYIKKRVHNIYPQYFVTVVLTAVTLVLISSYNVHDYFSSERFIKYLAANLTFMNFLEHNLPGCFEQNLIPFANGSLWTMKMEVGFYVCLPFIVKVVRGKRDYWKWLTGIYLSLFAVSLLIECGIDIGYLPNSLGNQLPFYGMYFVVGGVILLYYKEIGKMISLKWMLLAIPLLCMKKLIPEFLYMGIHPLLLGILVYYFTFRNNFLMKIQPKEDFTYAVYLIHWPVIQVLTALGFFSKQPVIAAVLCFILIICLSAYMENFFKIKIWNLLGEVRR